VIEAAGFTDLRENLRQPGGVAVDYAARDRKGGLWFFEVAGGFTSHRGGLKRAEVLWKVLGKAAVLREVDKGTPIVLLTTEAPVPGSSGAETLRQVTGPGKLIHAVIKMQEESGLDRLRILCQGDSVQRN
ncbi:MAG: hypothetical protein J2O47_09495, partial [Acidimicrobiaceae bacterium]|nr:hypothetical protein [Acidimicrobiaceae bacterium]